MNSFFPNGKLSKNDGTIEIFEIDFDDFVKSIETRSNSMLDESAFDLKTDEIKFKNFGLFFDEIDFKLDIDNFDLGFEIFNEILNIFNNLI